MAESAKAAAEYGVSREEFVGKASSFVKRAQLLGQVSDALVDSDLECKQSLSCPVRVH